LDEILAKDVMIRDVYTIHPKNRVALARLRMFRHGIGALPVVGKNNKLTGMITLRDIDLAGNDASSLLVEDLMTTRLLTASEETSISEIVDMMLRTGIQRIPVIDKSGRLIGLMTQTAVMKAAKKCFERT
jgi:CBS domain-containing protein